MIDLRMKSFSTNLTYLNHLIFYFFSLAAFFYFLTPALGMVPIGNDTMDEITGQSGITIAVSNAQIFTHFDRLQYIASDNGFIQFNELRIGNNSGGPATYNPTTGSGTAGVIYMDLGSVDVASLEDWDPSTSPSLQHKGMLGINVPEWDQDTTYLISDLVFNGPTEGTKHLGSLLIGPVDKPSYYLFTAPHGSGVDWEQGIEMHIGHLAYQYNNSSTSVLNFENIHIGNSFDYGLSGDDPTDPSTWKTYIGKFRIGDMFGNLDSANGPLRHSYPASFDVGSFTDGTGAIGLQLPMTGSIRFEKTEFGGVDFGPSAIDGIHAYRMTVFLIP